MKRYQKEFIMNLKKNSMFFMIIQGVIGRRYARNDEIGTPFCITIDEESLKNKDVTVRIERYWRTIRIKEKILLNV